MIEITQVSPMFVTWLRNNGYTELESKDYLKIDKVMMQYGMWLRELSQFEIRMEVNVDEEE